MKEIKILKQNSAAIEAALAEENGSATEHTFSTFSAISFIAEKSEARAYALLQSKNHLTGTIVTCHSGKSIANSYHGKRVATLVTIRRKAGGWYLTGVSRLITWGEAGALNIHFTEKQDLRAIYVLRKNYILGGEKK